MYNSNNCTNFYDPQFIIDGIVDQLIEIQTECNLSEDYIIKQIINMIESFNIEITKEVRHIVIDYDANLPTVETDYDSWIINDYNYIKSKYFS